MTQTEILACFYIALIAAVIMAIAVIVQNHFKAKRLRADREAADHKAEDERMQNILNQNKKCNER